jgi:hypothetical protein
MLYSHPLTSAPHSISAKVEAISPIDSSQDACEDSDSEIGKPCELYAQRECRLLCQEVCSRLPLELRDVHIKDITI